MGLSHAHKHTCKDPLLVGMSNLRPLGCTQFKTAMSDSDTNTEVDSFLLVTQLHGS